MCGKGKKGERAMSGYRVAILGFVVSLCVAVVAHGVELTASGYTFDFTQGADPNAVRGGDMMYGNPIGSGNCYWAVYGFGTLTYTFESGEPGMILETLSLAAWVRCGDWSQTVVTVTCTPEGGLADTVSFYYNSGAEWTVYDLTQTFEVNAPSATITYTIDRPDDGNGWKAMLFGGDYPGDGPSVFSATAAFADAPVPEPMTMSLLVLGGVAMLRRRR